MHVTRWEVGALVFCSVKRSNDWYWPCLGRCAFISIHFHFHRVLESQGMPHVTKYVVTSDLAVKSILLGFSGRQGLSFPVKVPSLCYKPTGMYTETQVSSPALTLE